MNEHLFSKMYIEIHISHYSIQNLAVQIREALSCDTDGTASLPCLIVIRFSWKD